MRDLTLILLPRTTSEIWVIPRRERTERALTLGGLEIRTALVSILWYELCRWHSQSYGPSRTNDQEVGHIYDVPFSMKLSDGYSEPYP